MIVFENLPIPSIKAKLNHLFLEQHSVDTGEWQSQNVKGKPEMAARELLNVSLSTQLPDTADELAITTGANMPWAEDHFQERVSGEPLNPPPSSEWWPYAQKNNAEHKSQGEQFSHTYPERMWPKFAGGGRKIAYQGGYDTFPNKGIRFEYGDLEDVVQQLKKSPLTRQAYLPIWFPEDTGAVHGERVPCTLGYHFLLRNRRLQITYYIRSCDYMRHFSDDLYMAGRLGQWMVDRYNEDAPRDEAIDHGFLVMHIVNFHVFEADVSNLRERMNLADQAESSRLMGLL